jgi:Ran GTPase-activating protein (RanGAP) involved in mRNA processing and transport
LQKKTQKTNKQHNSKKQKALDLSGNAISAQGAAAVAELLGAPDCPLRALSLAGCPLRDDGAAALAEALKVNAGLARLDLSNTGFGPEGAIALATALRTNCVLSVLSVAGSGIGARWWVLGGGRSESCACVSKGPNL